MLIKCRREVEQMYKFFQDWFTAHIPQGDYYLNQIKRSFAEDFQIITPEGHSLSRLDVTHQLKESYGAQKNRYTYRREIENFDGRSLTSKGEIFLCTYEEHQIIDDEKKIRLSTALFRKNQEAPNGVEWVHLHGIWI